MMKRILAAYSNIRMAPRIVFLILFILLTIIAVDTSSRHFTTMPDVYLFEQKWLINHISQTKEALEKAPKEKWGDILDEISQKQDWLDMSVISKEKLPPSNTPLTETLTLLKNALQESLNTEFSPIIATQYPYASFNRRLSTLTVITNKLPSRLIDELEDKGQGDVSISSDFGIYIPLSDGQWLFVETKKSSVSLSVYFRLFAAPVIGLLMILLTSFWMARSFLNPLQQLSAAAEKMGRERHISKMPDMHIPEYKTIANAFNEMQLQLKRFVDERTHMLAAISHDLRTLLTRIQLLVDDIDDKQKRRDILSNLSNMETMIKEYLVFARNDAKQEPYIQTDIASLLLSVCDTLDDAGGNVTYFGPDHAQLICQPVAMRRVFMNLVENGCKYGERTTVTLYDEKEFVQVIVADEGAGIPEHLMEQALKPFQRLETSRNRDTGGTGLGLSIARDIVLAHGGRLELENRAKGGLSVKVTLPKPRQGYEMPV